MSICLVTIELNPKKKEKRKEKPTKEVESREIICKVEKRSVLKQKVRRRGRREGKRSERE
jgi:hypothetical protein